MKTIKIISFLILILFVTLAVTFNKISNQNSAQDILLNMINEQKTYIQTISKDIFYIYKNKRSDTKNLKTTIAKFSTNLKNKNLVLNNVDCDDIHVQSDYIVQLYKKFIVSVESFQKLHSVASIYSDIILKDIVRDIYNKNMELVFEFDKLIKIQQNHYNMELNKYKYTQYIILIFLAFFLYYLFIQMKDNITFMQKFLKNSNTIISNSSIKDLKPINIQTKNLQTIQATKNFNSLVSSINTTLEHSSKSLMHSRKTLVILEENIEHLFDFVSKMQNKDEVDNDLSKKEDLVIQALEEVISSSQKLNNLKIALDNLIS